jgi:DNA-directed RNA polymerase beta subunit
MTIGHMIEMIMGKGACMSGKIADGTPFRELMIDEAMEVLKKGGYRRDGFERMYSGETGKMLRDFVYVGVLSYQRLVHLVSRKIHSRARGPCTVLTRAPVEGRTRSGAFRLSELLNACLAAQGVSSIIVDRLMNCSDPHECYVCTTCGRVAEKPAMPDSKIISVLHATAYCRSCDSNDNIVSVKCPYSFKLMLDEFAAMHLQTKLDVGI